MLYAAKCQDIRCATRCRLRKVQPLTAFTPLASSHQHRCILSLSFPEETHKMFMASILLRNREEREMVSHSAPLAWIVKTNDFLFDSAARSYIPGIESHLCISVRVIGDKHVNSVFWEPAAKAKVCFKEFGMRHYVSMRHFQRLSALSCLLAFMCFCCANVVCDVSSIACEKEKVCWAENLGCDRAPCMGDDANTWASEEIIYLKYLQFHVVSIFRTFTGSRLFILYSGTTTFSDLCVYIYFNLFDVFCIDSIVSYFVDIII